MSALDSSTRRPRAALLRHRSVATSVDVSPVDEVDDLHHTFALEDAVDDAERATARDVKSRQLLSKWLPDPLRVLKQGTSNELDDRGSHGLGHGLRNLAARRSGDAELP